MTSTLETIRRACTAQTVVPSPLGPLRLARTSRGLAGVWFEGQQHHPGEIAAPQRDDDPLLARAADQLRRYFAGTLQAFELPLDPLGSEFQRSVWQSLLRIPAGQTCSYSALATATGRPTATRAVAAAVGANPLSLVVPCHRVIGGDGALTGYAGGIERKRALLQLEQRACAAVT
jgi:methylated-DNA-[protein]-cysteine S-methyltransferase